MTTTFRNEFGTFTEGELVLYDVYPLGKNIIAKAYEDRIQAIDPDFIKECEKEGVSTYCLWEHVHDVRKVDGTEKLKSSGRKKKAVAKKSTPRTSVRGLRS